MVNDHFCGGVIVNKNYVLTAAHCVDTRMADMIKVRLGMHELHDKNHESQIHFVEVILSKELISLDKPGDIAVLKLKSPIKFVPGKIEPACINLEKKSYEFQDLLASGWGSTTSTIQNKRTSRLRGGDVSPVLKFAYFYEDPENCKDFLICIDSEKTDSICQGDSGGPIHSEPVNGKISVEGVASFVTGKQSDGEDIYMCQGTSAYSRLSYYKEWFEEMVENDYCSA